jgi:hypothetical protein
VIIQREKEQQAIQEKIEGEEKRKKELKHKIRQRREKYRTLTKKTKKGQPVMSNLIGNILEKLQKSS